MRYVTWTQKDGYILHNSLFPWWHVSITVGQAYYEEKIGTPLKTKD